MKKIAWILLLFIGCGQEQQVTSGYFPTIPVPVLPNEFVDTTFQTNGVSYWKTMSELNSKVYIRSNTCIINGEWIKDLDICRPHPEVQDSQPAQIFRVNIGKISVGDIYEIVSQLQFTNDTGILTGISSSAIISTNPDDVLKYRGAFNRVVPSNGENCLPEQHHCVHSKLGSFIVTEEIKNYAGEEDLWVIVLAWAYLGYQHIIPGSYIDVNLGQGSLSVLKIGDN